MTRARAALQDGRRHAWIQTFTGRAAFVLSPDRDVICIEDIAHSLSNQCRFLGHVREFYSVAQHSVLVSQLVPPGFALAGLLRDAAKAYLGDLVRPIKRYTKMGELFTLLEEEWMWAIEAWAGLTSGDLDAPEIQTADQRLLMNEKLDLLGPAPLTWTNTAPPFDHIKIVPLQPREARDAFMARWQELRP